MVPMQMKRIRSFGDLHLAPRKLGEVHGQPGKVHGQLGEVQGRLGEVHGQLGEVHGQLGEIAMNEFRGRRQRSLDSRKSVHLFFKSAVGHLFLPYEGHSASCNQKPFGFPDFCSHRVKMSADSLNVRGWEFNRGARILCGVNQR